MVHVVKEPPLVVVYLISFQPHEFASHFALAKRFASASAPVSARRWRAPVVEALPMNPATGGKIRLHDLITGSTQFELREPIAFARALKAATDKRDRLAGLEIDPKGATATCLFQECAGRKAQPGSRPTTYRLSTALAFARALKLRTDRNHRLIWIVVRCFAEADCWFD
jgi:hypothetical protein